MNDPCLPVPNSDLQPVQMGSVRPRILVIKEDYRLRTGHPNSPSALPGDRITLRDGTPGVIIRIFRDGDRWFVFSAPECLIDRDKYLAAHHDGTVPLITAPFS